MENHVSRPYRFELLNNNRMSKELLCLYQELVFTKPLHILNSEFRTCARIAISSAEILLASIGFLTPFHFIPTTDVADASGTGVIPCNGQKS